MLESAAINKSTELALLLDQYFFYKRQDNDFHLVTSASSILNLFPLINKLF